MTWINLGLIGAIWLLACLWIAARLRIRALEWENGDLMREVDDLRDELDDVCETLDRARRRPDGPADRDLAVSCN